MSNNVTIESIRKPQIVEAALQTIARKGFQNVTLDEVARAAGLSKGGLIHYFPSKDALVTDAFVEFFAGIFQRGREARDQVDDPLEKVLSFTWLYNWEDPQLLVGYRLFFDFMALASQDDSFRALFHDWVENWIVLLREPIAEGLEKGFFKVKDVELTARTVSAIYQGIAARWYLDRETHSTDWAVDSLRRAVTLLLTGEQGK
jgi:AcrR family transcriptional regulator